MSRPVSDSTDWRGSGHVYLHNIPVLELVRFAQFHTGCDFDNVPRMMVTVVSLLVQRTSGGLPCESSVTETL
ncbi:MAG TPA: hypothetical protein VGR47_00550 [Terracidiphilus sp.]|nr:hypothetical protein [Terracidiphilus sp.]